MSKKQNKPDALRSEAEAQLARAPPTETPARSVDELLRELQVHQIELEMQNESLRQTQRALEESRDHYVNLYEFAPVGCITLTKTGKIAEINLTGVALIGEDRKKLLKRRFDEYVVSEDQDRWHRYFVQALEHGRKQSCEVQCRRRDGKIFNCNLDCRLIKVDNEMSMLHITLTDITEQKQAEKTRRQFETRMLKLTSREREVLVLALSGIPNKQISIQLQISQRTVENHRSRIHHKTGVITLLELAQQAANAGVTLAEIALISSVAAI